MLPENGMLGYKQSPNLGKSVRIAPAIPEAGQIVYVQNFPFIPPVSADPQFQWDNGNVSLAIDCHQLNREGSSSVLVLLQGVIAWEAAQALFGSPGDQELVDPIVAGRTFTEVIFDIQNGMVMTLPAAVAATLRLRYTAYRAAGFNGIDAAGPAFRLNAGWSYGNITPQKLTMTQIGYDVSLDTLDLVHGGVGTMLFAKPKFATEFYVAWQNYQQVANEIRLSQFSYGNSGIPLLNYANLGTAAPGPVPPIVYPWYAPSTYAQLLNISATTDANIIQLVSTLSL